MWSHIVSERCGKETLEESIPVTERILLLCGNIMDTCTEHSYKTSLEKLFRPFVETTFLTSTLKQFINNAGKIPRNRYMYRLILKLVCKKTCVLNAYLLNPRMSKGRGGVNGSPIGFSDLRIEVLKQSK